MAKVAFIGLGVMGYPMAGHLKARGGHEVTVYNRTRSRAEAWARDGWLVTFGIRPHAPATGYGYLERGASLGKRAGLQAFEVRRFVEKPDLEKARRFLREGTHDWNSGMFAWTTATILEELGRRLPRLHERLNEIVAADFDPAQVASIFPAMESISIDYGVMERADRVACVPCDPGWSDVGSWPSLHELKREQPDPFEELRVVRESSGCFVQAPAGKLTALIGVDDLVVVDTGDVLLVCPRDRCEEIKELVRVVGEKGLDRYL